MSKVLLKNTNPLGFVDVPMIGRVGLATDVDEHGKPTEGVGCVAPGEVVEVDAKIAGRAPFWRDATPEDAEVIARNHIEHREVDRSEDPEHPDIVTEVHDLGWGLLAQLGNWKLVEDKDPLKGLNLDQLKDYAAEHNIDLGGAKTKADITAAIRKG